MECDTMHGEVVPSTVEALKNVSFILQNVLKI